MALLCAGVDSNRIRLVGRCRSDEMYRYLHVQAQPVMTGLSAAMLQGGALRLTPSRPSFPPAFSFPPSPSVANVLGQSDCKEALSTTSPPHSGLECKAPIVGWSFSPSNPQTLLHTITTVGTFSLAAAEAGKCYLVA